MIALFLFLLFLPTQLAYHFWPDYSLIYGLRIDYLSPAIYFTDLLLIPLFLSNPFINTLRSLIHKHKIPLILLLLLLIPNIYFSISPLVSLVKLVKYFEIILLIIYVKSNQSLIKKLFITSLKYSVPLILFIALMQIITQGSLNTFFYWLGERRFTISTPGIALVYLFNNVYLRPYATFSHPNSLAGFYLVTFLLYISLVNKPNKLLLIWLISLILISFSLNAILGLILISLLYTLTYIYKFNSNYFALLLIFAFSLISFLLPVMSSVLLKFVNISNLDYVYRLELSVIAGYLFSQNPLFGIGFNNFILNLPDSFQILSNISQVRFNWWLQPVHNIYLLLLSEVGLFIYLIIFISLSKSVINKKLNLKILLPLIAILFTGLFDHYWLTLQQNQLLMALTFGLIL